MPRSKRSGPSPLAGLRVAVTRPLDAWEPGSRTSSEDRLVVLLRERGAIPYHFPTTAILPPRDAGDLEEAVSKVGEYDWLILTSRRAVAPFEAALRIRGLTPVDVREAGVRVCAVGPTTADALARIGLPPEIVPDRFVAEALADALLGSFAGAAGGMRALLPRAEDGREVIPERLEAAGVQVDVVAAYRTVSQPEQAGELARRVQKGEIDALTFTSGSTARSFGHAWREGASRPSGRVGWPVGVGVVVIGPVTEAATRGEGVPVHEVAESHDLDGLVLALETWAGRSGRGSGEDGSQ